METKGMETNRTIVENQEPKEVLRYFAELASIPHGSGNMEQVSEYCVQFAKKHRLQYIQDEHGNLILIKEASKGYEASETVILQGHLDMVCEKTADRTIDFTKDALQLKMEGSYLYAEGTTLGGDDGIAVAYILAILADDTLQHPRLEAILTVNEEIGLLGATQMDVSMIRGRKMINLDSEEEGILLTSCAGGATVACTLKPELEPKAVLGKKVLLTVSGLAGGHSGCEIDKGRANSNVLMGRAMVALQKLEGVSVVELAGGLKDNAIPRETRATLLISNGKIEKIKETLGRIEEEIRSEYATSDPEIVIQMEVVEESELKVWTKDSFQKAVTMLINLPNGVQKMSSDLPGLVETSLNLGVLSYEEGRLQAIFCVRSSIESAKEYLIECLANLMDCLGGSCEVWGRYPGWVYKRDSVLRETARKAYLAVAGKEPQIEAIHAGLECGIFANKLTGLDCISMGPEILNIHTTEERMNLKSVERTWRLLLEILKRLI